MEENSKLNYKAVVRYSLALYKVAKEQAMEEELERDSSLIIECYDSNERFGLLFTNPLLTPQTQSQIVKSLFSYNTSDRIKIQRSMYAFISLLAKNNRLNILRSCLSRFKSMIVSKNTELKINVTSVKAINKDLKEQIIEIFSTKLKRKVNISNIVNKDILGGIIIELGSNLIDLSIRSKIDKINAAIKGVN